MIERILTATAADGSGAEDLAEAADAHELAGLEARSPDKRAVNVRLLHDRGYIGAFDGTAVEDPYDVGDVGAERLGDPAADRADHLLGVGRGGGLAGADGPHRLVRD